MGDKREYRLWECDENRWSQRDGRICSSDEEAIEWMNDIVKSDYAFWDNYAAECNAKRPDKQYESHTVWAKRNYPDGHYTLFIYVKGEEPAV